MLRLLNKIMELSADAAVQEMGVPVVTFAGSERTVGEKIEESLVEVAFAEAADYDDIHRALEKERLSNNKTGRTPGRTYGNKEKRRYKKAA